MKPFRTLHLTTVIDSPALDSMPPSAARRPETARRTIWHDCAERTAPTGGRHSPTWGTNPAPRAGASTRCQSQSGTRTGSFRRSVRLHHARTVGTTPTSPANAAPETAIAPVQNRGLSLLASWDSSNPCEPRSPIQPAGNVHSARPQPRPSFRSRPTPHTSAHATPGLNHCSARR